MVLEEDGLFVTVLFIDGSAYVFGTAPESGIMLDEHAVMEDGDACL